MRRNKSLPLGEVLRSFLREEGLETPLNEYRLVQAWPEVMGEVISNYTGNIGIRNCTLYVQIKSPALRQNLMMGRAEMIQKLNAHVGAQVINNIVLY